jgi:hypothetical protein
MKRCYRFFESVNFQEFARKSKLNTGDQLEFSFEDPPQNSTKNSNSNLSSKSNLGSKSKKSRSQTKKKKKFPIIDIANFNRRKLTAQLRIHKQLEVTPEDPRHAWNYYELDNIDAATIDIATRLLKKKKYYQAYKTVQPYIVKKNIPGQRDLPNLDDYKEFTIKDFKFQGSDLTKKFRKERNKVLGQEVKVVKLVDFDFNTNKAIFITQPTFLSQTQKVDQLTNTFSIDNVYTMEVEFVDLDKWKNSPWKDLTLREFREILSVCDVKLSCDCPAHTFQGHRYNLTQLDSAIYPLHIPDPVWRKKHDGKGGLCKHLLGLVNDFGMLASVVLGQIKKRAKLKNIQY